MDMRSRIRLGALGFVLAPSCGGTALALDQPLRIVHAPLIGSPPGPPLD
jgi:hypothetical protein